MTIPTGILARNLAVPLFLFSGIFCLPAAAQWIHYPTPGIPRTPDGKPDLAATAPRNADGKPDFSGLWRTPQAASGETDKAMHNIKAQPWAEDLAKKHKDNLGNDSPSVLCLPSGPQADVGVGKIVQTSRALMMFYDDLTYRQVFLDGRPLPPDPNPTWMGYSIGHWDGDTLVIESAGFNDRTWLDSDGHPHTEALRVTERLRRPDFGHLEIVRKFEDPQALKEPWVVPIQFEYDADTEMIEYVCAENERDRRHLVGTAADDKRAEVNVSPEILRDYAGIYEFKPPERPDDPVLIGISVDGGRLMAAMNGGSKVELTALSETKFFFQGARIEFVKGAQGAVEYMNIQAVEGDFKATRKK